MEGYLGTTESVCPVCLRRVSAVRVVEDGDIYLKKDCPEHGTYKVIIWRGAEHYPEWDRPGRPGGPKKRLTPIERGCPYDCGLCPKHKQDTCTVLMEVTNRCDLSCPICFASSNELPIYQPDLREIKGMYQTILESGGPYPIQLSGGEPALRDDLPEIVGLARDLGFDHIQVNTNGVRLAEDLDYLLALKDSGTSVIFLSFDGVSNGVYRQLRGIELLDLKIQVLKNCSEAKMGVILVPTVIPGVNFQEIGEIIQFAKGWIPTVKGVHFQPISYFGRYPGAPEDEDRITIPDVLRALEVQTEGEVKFKNFIPPT